MSERDNLKLSSALSAGVRVRKVGPMAWTVNEPQQDDYRLTRLVRIQNDGKPTSVTIHMTCANPSWMSHLYLVQKKRVTIIPGKAGDGRSTFTFEAPPGESVFGPEVWYDNAACDRFLKRMLRNSDLCQADVIGQTLEDRPIHRLTIGKPDAPHTVVVAGREHADEPSGSFAVEAVADHILEQIDRDPLYRDCRFDLLPIVSPDGVAHGEAYAQPGKSTVQQPNTSDPHYCGMDSDDPTVVAYRNYLFAQKPTAFVNYHAYWALSFPQVIFYDKRDGLAMVDSLIDEDMDNHCRWYVMRQAAERRTMHLYCIENFDTVVAMYELPWRGRSVKDVRQLGVKMFESTMTALRQRLGEK